MIKLTKVRLINWYGFSNITAPIGSFTLIAGKNGNGKSVMLDAIKYALYGDTVFNKSTENKGSRTVSSYTRGLLDATAGSYMRPVEKMPTVYTHIVLEMVEQELNRTFLLGTVIETNSSNNVVTHRYVMEDKCLQDMEHTYFENDSLYIYSASQLQRKYGIRMMAVSEGLSKFMQRTGLRFNENQLSAFRRKLRSIMSYDPNAKIDQFIRESVLEEKTVDFSKLVETKSHIDALTQTFEAIDLEIKQLEEIITLFEQLKVAQDEILADDIKIAYKDYLKYQKKMEDTIQAMNLAKKQIEEDQRKLAEIEEKEADTRAVLGEARINLEQMDCAKAISDAQDALAAAEQKKLAVYHERACLLNMQTRVSELLNWMIEENQTVIDKGILVSLTEASYSGVQKENTVELFVNALKAYRDELISKVTRLEDEQLKNDKDQARCHKIIEECNAKKTSYSEIADYVALKKEINEMFQKKGIQSEAHFACEYVISLRDEAWRDVIEGYLGRRRYTILVEPEYYDLADEVFHHSKHKSAHMFQTKFLMKKEITPVSDSVVNFIEIKNTMAQKYFDYQLGRFHAVSMNQVREYENAMSKEGRVCVGMDSYFIRFQTIKSYYLGQKTIEINRDKANACLEELKQQRNEIEEQLDSILFKKAYLEKELANFGRCNYDACQDYEDALRNYSRKQMELNSLVDAQQNNMEFLQLSERVTELRNELDAIAKEMNLVRDDKSNQQSIYKTNENEHHLAKENLEHANQILKEYKISNNVLYAKAVTEYKQYLEAGKNGKGGCIRDRAKAEKTLRETSESLRGAQYAYNVSRTAENQLPTTNDSQAVYQSRKDQIWMDDRQEITDKLKEQTRRYEQIFKNEFVLTVLKSCEAARADLKMINAELSRLHFKSVYEFEVNYVKDGSDYEKILEYAEYLKEREELGSREGQYTFDSLMNYSNDQGEQLEQEIKKLINRIVSGNDPAQIERFADYRNYMNYEILVSNQEVLNKAKLSKQSGYNSGAEVQIPYMLILLSALLMIYNDKSSSTRLVFIDEPFAKMDPTNVKIMLGFMKEQNLQMIFCAPDKTDLIGNECEVILPVLRTRPDFMEIGIIEMHQPSIDA